MAARFALVLAMTAASRLVMLATDPSVDLHSESGLYRVQFHVAEGTIRMNYPDDMAVGDSISGTVYTEAAGKDQKERDKNSKQLAGYFIVLENQKLPSSEKHFQWSIPTKVSQGGFTLLLRNSKGQEVARLLVPVDQTPVPSDYGGFDLPNGAQAGTFVSVSVPTNTNLGSSVTVGGEGAPVVAESPRKLVFLSPADALGSSTLRVTKNGASAEGPYRGLGLQLRATKTMLMRGETATFTAVLSGLQGDKETVSMTIINRSPQIVNLTGGPLQHITIRPGDVRGDGTYQLDRALTGEMGGAFNISVVATRPPTSQVPLARLTDRTIERWSQTNHIPVSPQARSLISLGTNDARLQLDEFMGSQLPWHADPVTLFDWMVRDYCFDLRDQILHGAAHSELRGFSGVLFVSAVQEKSDGNIGIEAADVRRFSFSQYLAGLLARLTPSQPVGHLTVASQPVNQAVKIDAFTGESYFTTRAFIVSVGTHTVLVSTCHDVVSISANQGFAISCPHQ